MTKRIKRLKEREKYDKNTMPINRILLPILFFVFSIILEFANFLYLGLKDINGNLIVFPSYFLFDIAIIFIIAGVIYLVQKKKAMLGIMFFFLSLQFLMNIVNSTMYSIFGDILSFDLLYLGAEATTAITLDFIDWGGVFLNIAIFAIIITITVILVKKNRKTITLKTFSKPIIVLSCFILCQSLGFSFFAIQKSTLQGSTSASTEIETSDEYLWDNFQFKIDAFKKFGYYGFYAKSIYGLFENKEVDVGEYKQYIDEGYVAGDSSAPLYGDNLIVILCESLDWYAIDPFNTPTLWKLAEGDNTLVFREFYARNRTNYSEGISMLGSMPKNSSLSNAYKKGYTFDYSLPNLFEQANAGKETVTAYFHDSYQSFYARSTTHGNDGIGFDNLYFQDDYTGEVKYKGFGHWRSDLEFISNLADKFMPQDKRFLSYFASVSTHGPYNYRQEGLSYCYEIFEDNYEEYSKWLTENTKFYIPENKTDFDRFCNYKASIIDFDKTIEFIIQNLKDKGLYENTSILLFSDHNSYYTNMAYKIKGVEKSDFSNTYINNIPVLLHSPKLTGGEGEQIYTYCNTYDLLPTICHLYGMASNSNLYQGYSIFSNEIKNSVFVSHLSGMFTNNLFSMNISEVYVVGENVTEYEINRFKINASRYFEKQDKIEDIYKNAINGTKITI